MKEFFLKSMGKFFQLRIGLRVACALALLSLAYPQAVSSQPASSQAVTETAYFKFQVLPYPETFVFQVSDAQVIQEARDILAGNKPSRHILGTIIPQRVIYNFPWSYHLDPATVRFFDNTLEVCDGTITYVEENLLNFCRPTTPPDCTWCPWNSKLVAEMYIQFSFMYLPLIQK